jgi:hypothetical protein
MGKGKRPEGGVDWSRFWDSPYWKAKEKRDREPSAESAEEKNQKKQGDDE